MIGTYTYKVPDYYGGFKKEQTRVEVIGETDKSYKVRFLEFGRNGTRPGYETYVSKTKVRVDGQSAQTHKTFTGGVRLPYKED